MTKRAFPESGRFGAGQLANSVPAVGKTEIVKIPALGNPA
jgi:hypothetical protein